MALILKGRAKLKGSTVIGKRPYAIDGVFNPELVLDFQKNYYRTNSVAKTFPNAITHTRAANATMVDSDGVLKWGPHNLLLRSEEFDNAVWSKFDATVTANATVAPNGTNTADQITYTTAADARLIQNNSVSAGEHTFGIWVKGTAGETITLELDATVDQVTLSADWVLYTLTRTFAAGSQTIRLIRRAGDTALTVYFWGAHLYRSDLGGMVDNPERGDSYVPTTTSAVYMPRLGHHVWNGTAWVNEGLLHESEARTNLLTYSEDLSNAEWFKGNTTLGAGITAPDGTTNSTKLIPNTVSTEHFVQDALTAATGTFTDSVFAKADEFKFLVLRPVHIGADQGATQSAVFDLLAGSTSDVSANCTAQIQDFGNGWYRCSFTFTVSGTITGTNVMRIQVFNNTKNISFAGDGTSGIYVFGAQREIAPTPSSYIPTLAGSTVTRAADVLTIPAANLPYPEPVVIGPELVTNGTFDTDVSGWSAGSGAVLSVSNGQLVVSTLVGDNFGTTYQEIATVAGSVYEMKIDRISTNQEFSAGVSTTQLGAMDVLNLNSSGGVAGSFSGVFVGTGSNVFIRAGVGFNSTFEGTAVYDNISVREINPLAVSIQMDGRVTYADLNENNQHSLYSIVASVNENIQANLETDAGTGDVEFIQAANNIYEIVQETSAYSPDILVPFNVASRHGSTFINGAIDGVALTADTTPVALPDLSATNLRLGFDYNGTIRTFRMWAQDIGDTGLVEATEPSLVPSLSLTFDGTENSFIVEDWSE